MNVSRHIRWPASLALLALAFALPPAPVAAQAAAVAQPAPAPAAAALAPPVAKRQPVTTTIHGEALVDDYAWLRQKGTPEVEAHLTAERDYAEAFMRPTAALQQKLYDEMLGRIQQTDTNVPYLDRGYWYYSRTEEGKQYPIYARRKGSMDAPEQVILDVNALAEGKQFMSVASMAVSPDGNLLAYTTDETGFRQFRLHVKDLTTAEVRPETAERVTSVEWAEDGRTLFFSVEDPQTKRSHQVYRQVLGGAPAELLHEEKDERFNTWVWKSRDDRWLFLENGSLTTSESRFIPADQPNAEWRLIAAREQEHQYDVEPHGDTLWIRTNDKGRNFRLVTAPIADPARARWTEVIAHRDDVMLAGHWLFQDFYVLLERESGFPHLRVTRLAGGESHRVEVPETASHVSLSANPEFDTPTFRFAYQSPVTSPSVFEYDPARRERKLLKQTAVLGGYDPSRYTVEVTWAPAQDGVKVPMWLLYRKGLARDGSNPTLLGAYGSYGSSGAAFFNSNVFSLVDRGMVYAYAYIRGGGELGKKWHDDGRMLRKMNTFTDFIAAAEHLVRSKYTRPDRLAITGGSAGGLLMGAVTNMRPDLFGVVISHVPFVDVLNTMLDPSLPLTVAEFEEWGNPKIEEQYRYMRQYSPYENIAARDYPTILVKTSYNDSQVMYWEPAKYVARLRATKTDDNPLLLHINMEPAGHGGKSGRYNRLREIAFDYAFTLWQLGVEKLDEPKPAQVVRPGAAR